ncbi:hypothetical protein SNEBB_002120 [Seison nebaliae]|nr:hypothetical protein SNEBB_002120 [Seison nebaliae]
MTMEEPEYKTPISETQNEERENQPISFRRVQNYHPLTYRWTFWYYNSSLNSANFWTVFKHLPVPSQLPYSHDYMFFRSGIQPIYEKPENRQGGVMEANLLTTPQLFDVWWRHSLLALIGHQFDEYTQFICGLFAKKRSKTRLAMWLNTKDVETIRAIAQCWRTVCEVDCKQINFKAHSDRTICFDV